MLRLKLPYCGRLMWRADSLEKTLMLEKNEVRRRRGWRRMRWFGSITNSTAMNLSTPRRWWRTEKPGVLQSMGPQSDTAEWPSNSKGYYTQRDYHTEYRRTCTLTEAVCKIWDKKNLISLKKTLFFYILLLTFTVF